MKKTFLDKLPVMIGFRVIEIMTCFFIIAGVIRHW